MQWMFIASLLALFSAYAASSNCKCSSGPAEELSPVGKAGENCLFYSSEPSTWWSAEEACAAKGGHLASIPDDAANSILVKNSSLKGLHWIGSSFEDSHWKWSDGGQIGFSKWKEEGTSQEHGGSVHQGHGLTGIWPVWSKAKQKQKQSSNPHSCKLCFLS